MSGWIKNMFKNKLSILDMMALRDEEQRIHNEEIIKLMPHVTDAILDLISTSNAQNLRWTDVIYAASEDILILIGTVESKVGDRVPLDTGEVIDVTPFNIDSFSRVLKIGVPLLMAESGTQEEVAEFLNNSAQEQLEKTIDGNIETLSTADIDEDVYTESEEEFDQLIEAFHAGFDVPLEQFDVDELNDEQYEQLMIFERYNGKGNKH